MLNVFKLFATNLAFPSSNFYYASLAKNFYYDTYEGYSCLKDYEL